MLLRREHTYDATPDEVFDMLADPDFRARVSEAQDVVSHDVVITPSDSGFFFVNDQVQRTAGLPAIAKKFAGDTTRAVQRENWTSRTEATLSIETPGKPSEMTGTVRLEPAAGGTLETIEIDARVKVPLIGGKLEGLLVETVSAALTTEFEVGDAWLRGERA